jgi:hypothetical protein
LPNLRVVDSDEPLPDALHHAVVMFSNLELAFNTGKEQIADLIEARRMVAYNNLLHSYAEERAK